MQRKMSHWLTRAAFLPLSVALVVDAALAAAGMPQLAQYTPLAVTTSRASGAGQVLLAQATPRAHPLGAEGRRGSVPGHLKRVTAGQIVVVIDRTISRAVKQGTEISFELTPQTEFKGEQSGQPLTAAAMEKGRPVVVGYTIRSGQEVVVDWVRIKSGPVIAFEGEGRRTPRPLTPGQEQRARESGLEQPWQTSWGEFCGELQRLFQSGATRDAMDAQFAGKPVIWEGEIIEFDGPDNSLVVRMPECRVTVAEADNRSAEVGVLGLRFKSLDEIYRLGGITVPAKVRFSTVLRTPPDPNSPAGKFSNFGIFHPVSWIEEEEEGEKPRLLILVGIGDGTKLLEYVGSQAR